MKPGVAIDIPGFGRLELHVLVSDYTGTISFGGKISAAVERRIVRLAEVIEIHILTADTFGTAEREIGHLPVTIHRLEQFQQDAQKMRFVEGLNRKCVAAFGNGNNDRLLLRSVRDGGGLAVAVDNGEGCAVETLQNANIFITGVENALDLLSETDRLKATLRF
jgi:soluble P-type ATPase